MSKILIIDDQPYVRELLSEELEDEGYTVASIGDAESLTRYLSDSKPDLVLLDLFLTGLKGWDLLLDIKAKHPLLPVLIVTAYDNYVDDPRLSQADGYLIKNIPSFDGLKKKIAEILN